VLGDFNCEWNERKRSLDRLRQELALRPAESTGHATFPSWRPLIRLDWILVSEELDFASYDTLPDRLSDHLGVVADVRLRGFGAAAADDDEPTRVIAGRGRSRRG
jgi:endonuclease/exonuclease/phosphatase family metal-dependent hydrolase